MELPPAVYHRIIRSEWISEIYIKNVLQKGHDLSGKRVLDFGCGIGCNCTMFSPDAYVGFDIDKERIQYARRIYPQYRFFSLDEDFYIESHSLDHILFIAVLHHIPTEDLEHYLQEFKKLLKPEGTVMVIEPYHKKNALLRNAFMNFFDNGKYIRSKEEYFNLFRHMGYQIDESRTFTKLLMYHELFFTAALDPVQH